MRNVVRQIPNFITILNLVSGIIALFFAIDGHLVWAGIFICVAAVFDFLDGMAARLLNAQSQVGKQLDSMADLVSFGVAPGAILFTLLKFSLFDTNLPIYDLTAQWFEWLILSTALLIPILGAIRLARFNTLASEEPFFRGLPIPTNGLFWASLGLLLEFPRYKELFQLIFSTKNLVFFGIILSGMMITSLPMFSLKFKNLSVRENWYLYLFLLLAILLFAFFGIYGLTFVILLYIVLNLVFYLIGINF